MRNILFWKKFSLDETSRLELKAIVLVDLLCMIVCVNKDF